MTGTSSKITTAMVLSAGLGTRMRPLTLTKPKPLIAVNGISLLDHNLDQLEKSDIKKIIVNVHYLGEQIIDHIKPRKTPEIIISDERDELLDSGGGINAALPQIGEAPFFILNSDSFWIEHQQNNLHAMTDLWNVLGDDVDILLLLSEKQDAIGFDGAGDFFQNSDGTLFRRGKHETAPLIYAGCAILRPQIFKNVTDKKFSLNEQFNAAIASGKLYGITLNGLWLHVGTPEGISKAEKAIELKQVAS